jgi:hypothetical protein
VAAGKLVEAREVFLGIGRLPVAPQETARSAAARTSAGQLADQVRGRIPKLTVRITGATPDAVTVTIDGSAVPSDALGAPRLVNPGKHDIAAAPTSGARASASVELKEGDTREVELHVTPAVGPSVASGAASPGSPGSGARAATPGGSLAGGDSSLPSSETPPAPSSAAKRVLIYGGFGLAAAGVAAGAITGFLAMGKASSVNDACHNTLNCPRSIDDDLQNGRTMGTVSTIAFAAAGAGAVAGVIGLLIGPKKESAPPATAAAWITPWVGPAGAGVAGVAQF